ncbi:type II secretion system F family protein [Halomicroarcula sp. GCM10025324]|uniref:type II secretion system F family protein n=1 Tax=Haloarcula TaxID=2237 RepID=UPI0023E8CF9C|nr:type II secretion system F family protein [Halomicroarcula sp. ZS-22-S1]
MGGDEYRRSNRDSGAPEPSISHHQDPDPIRPEDSDEFREQYGYVRSYYRLRPEKHTDLQRWLNQARFGQNYDAYLERTAIYAILAAVIGVLAGVGLTYALLEQGVIASLSNPLAYRGDLTVYLGENRALFSGMALAIGTAVALAAGVWFGRYYYPRSVVGTRRRNINVTLPHAITFMYALSYGGMDLLEIIRVLGSAQDTYGEVANEFQTVVRDVELFGNDLYSGLQNARNLTPSDNFEQFFDDLLSVLDSGGDVTVFLENQTDTYLEDARDEQTGFLETLSLLSEIFVVLFVAAPLFLIVILIVMSLLGAQTVGQITLLVYAVMPLAMGLFLVLLDTLSSPFTQAEVRLDEEHHVTSESIGRLSVLVGRDVLLSATESLRAAVDGVFGEEKTLSEDEWEATQQTAYLRQRRRRYLRESLETPFAVFERAPLYTLLITGPLAALWVGGVVTTGTAELSWQGFLDAPRFATVVLVVAPLLVTMVPLTLFAERKFRREKRISSQFPDTMNALSSANKMGVPTTEALGLVAKWSSGPIETELQKVRNDIEWNHDTSRALRAFADRLRVPQLSRAIKLIAEGMRSSSDLARVLSIAADDTRNRFKIEQQRRRELSSYVAVVVIGFLVYLLVVALLTTAYLEPISAVSTEPTGTDVESPVSISNLPVAAYETLFFHSAIIQGFGSGLLAGKLVDNKALSGLKYSIGLVLLSTAAFLFI